jgi:nitrite reductase/ring-hydroxylating ferredoxin subunit/multimeric flavodoxin WrbA
MRPLKNKHQHGVNAMTEGWVDIGSAEELARTPLKSCKTETIAIAISFKDGQFGAVSNVCNHVGGPLGEGRLDGDYITCPWHGWKFHCRTGVGELGFEQDRVPAFPVKVESGRVLVNIAAPTRRTKAPHQPHPLARKPERSPGPPRLAGISTTVMDQTNPRFSGSDHLLDHALKAAADLGAETRLIRLNDLKFRACEGYYSKAAQACTWPCSITQMDASDELDRVYDAFVHWADAVIVASPIRWGTASSLYFKMAERMNCVQNQITIANRVLIRNKVAGFIIVGGQDNIQMVAGQMLGFFAELGFISAVPVYRAFARLVARGHGEQRRDRAKLEGARRWRVHACEAAARSRGTFDCAGRGTGLNRARWTQSPSGVDAELGGRLRFPIP